MEGNCQMGTWAGRRSPRWIWLCCAVLLGSFQGQAKRQKVLNQGGLPFCLSVRGPRFAWKTETTMAIYPLVPCKWSNFCGPGFHTSQIPTWSQAALPFGRDLLPVIPLHSQKQRLSLSVSPGLLSKRACCSFSWRCIGIVSGTQSWGREINCLKSILRMNTRNDS